MEEPREEDKEEGEGERCRRLSIRASLLALGGITIPQGEFAVFKPTGTVKIKNLTGGEQVTYEYFIIGR